MKQSFDFDPAGVSASFALVALLCRWPRSDAWQSATRAAAAQVSDWPHFLHVTDLHRIWGMAADALRAAQADVPPFVRDALASRARRIALQNLYLAQEGARLQRLFQDGGVDVLLYKGIALARQAYGTIAFKHGHDIDLLVRPEDVARSLQLLEAEGYRAEAGFSDKRFLIETFLSCQQEIRLFRKDVLVELHWHLVNSLPQLDTLLWSAREEIPVDGGGRMTTFSRPEHLLYLSVHGSFHNWFRLKWLADFQALLQGATADETKAFLQKARLFGMGCCALSAIRLCMQVFGTALPAGVRAEELTGWRIRLMCRLCLRVLCGVSPMRKRPFIRIVTRLLNALWLDGLRNTCRYISRSFYYTFDIQMLPLPVRLRFLYPLLRVPLWIFRRIVVSEK